MKSAGGMWQVEGSWMDMFHYKNLCDLIEKKLTKLCQLFRQLRDLDSDT